MNHLMVTADCVAVQVRVTSLPLATTVTPTARDALSVGVDGGTVENIRYVEAKILRN